MPIKNVLVVGGAGYIGGAVTDVLLERGDVNFRVYDNLLYESAYRKNVDFVFGDVLNTEELLPHLKWADAVIWLAAIVGDGACTINPNLTTEVNQNSVAWLAQNYHGRIIFTSTCSIYGAQEGLLHEESSPRPLSLYAGTKLKAESFLKDKNALICRLGTLYGVSDLFSRVRFDLVVNYMTAYALNHGEINVYGGNQFRPLLHVKDIAQALVDGVFALHTGIFNMVERNMRIIDLAYSIKKHFTDLKVNTTEVLFEDTRNYQVSGHKAQETLMFIPRYSIDHAIEELRHLMQTKKIKHWADDRYSNERFLKTVLEQNVVSSLPISSSHPVTWKQ